MQAVGTGRRCGSCGAAVTRGQLRLLGAAAIRIRDNGVGIPKEMLSRVFDLFTQIESGAGGRVGGLGIGLTLVRHLVELHGGTVHVTSDGSGHGSEFVVRLPSLPAQPDAASMALEQHCPTD